MRISKIEAIPFNLQRTRAVRARTIGGDMSRHVLIRISTDEGVFGEAEALSKVSIYGETQQSIVAIVQGTIAPRLVGLDPVGLDEANGRLQEIPANNSARAAVDIALHDLFGKISGLPLHRLWGSTRREQVVSWTLGLNPPDQMAQEAVRVHRELGIRAFKVKGGEVPADDVAAVHAIRASLPDAQLSLDANEGYTAKVAIRTLAQMVDARLDYVEEPIPHHDRRGRVETAREIPIPILGDDSCFTLADVVREVELGAIGMVSIKTPRTGFWESHAIRAVAVANGLSCVVGTAVGGALSSLAALQFSCSRNDLAGPSENSFGMSLDRDVVASWPRVSNGTLTAPIGAGLGAEVSPDLLAELATG
jgi:L-alanine-DL-glutamate epimerase-like enolase superfamily enzyme